MKVLVASLFLFTLCCRGQRLVVYENQFHSFKFQLDSVSSDGKNYDCFVTKIFVYDKPKGVLSQTIVPPENMCFCKTDANRTIRFDDINFDGIVDFMIPQLIPSSPNIPYYYWKFNKKTKRFDRDTTLEDITSPNFDPDQKLITSFWRSSADDHGVSTYKYINGQITLIEETESSQDPDNPQQRIFTHKKLVDGKLILTDKNFEKAEEAPKGK